MPTLDRRVALELNDLAQRPDAQLWRAAWRAQERWDQRWQRALVGYFTMKFGGLKIEPLARDARRAWKQVRKATPPPPPPSEGAAAGAFPDAGAVATALAAQVAVDKFVQGAMVLYTGLALDTSETAGQFTLDALGLNHTFRWAGQRDFIRDRAAVHGSKIIEQSVRGHLERLADLAVRAADPAQPKTMAELTKEIRQEWEQLTRAQAIRIARTEAANVWERTNWYAMRANDVKRVKWLIAAGPAIGHRVGPVCEACLERKAGSPYDMDKLDELPPLHPNCRCTLVPVLTPTWLPPAEPWTGSQSIPQIFDEPPGTGPVAKSRTALAYGWDAALLLGVQEPTSEPVGWQGGWQ